jgi:hypothetical protein
VRQGKLAPCSCSSFARARASSSVRWRQPSVAGGAGCGVGEHGQHERLGVPEGVPVVAGPGEALGGDWPLLSARARLQDVKEREADSLLQLAVAVHFHVGALPEVVEVRTLLGQEMLPTVVCGARQRRCHLVAKCGHRARARPAVGEVLHHSQRRSWGHVGRDRHAREIIDALGRDVRARWAVHGVGHCRADHQRARARCMDEYCTLFVRHGALRLQRQGRL